MVHAWRNSPDVRAYMYTDHVIGADEHARWWAGIGLDERRAYWIIELDGQPVGLANLADIDALHGRATWAYYLADPAVRGKGLGSFVEMSVLEEVFRRRRLRKLWCEVLVTNEAVWRLHESFGFHREATFRGHVIKAGQPVDVVGLGIFADEWEAARPAQIERLRSKGYDVN